MEQILSVGKNTRGTGVEDRTLEAPFKVKLKEGAETYGCFVDTLLH